MEDQNFHGASQVAQALGGPRISPLLSVDYRFDSFYVDLHCLTVSTNIPLNDYLDLIDGSKILEKENVLLPIDRKFWKGLHSAYWNFIICEASSEILVYAQTLKNFRTIGSQFCDLKHPLQIFVSSLKPLPYNVIDELSQFYHKRECQLPVYQDPIKLAEWTSGRLVHFLSNEGKEWKLAESLFAKGIYTGEKFIEEFAKDKNLIVKWPQSLKFIIWMEYLLHLSVRNMNEPR